MIVGIGIDCEQVERFKDLTETHPLIKIFSDSERDYCSQQAQPAQHFAARWCAREALRKALPSHLRPDWRSIWIERDSHGAPHFGGPGMETLLANNLHAHLSVTHAKELASAYVVVEFREATNAVRAFTECERRID